MPEKNILILKVDHIGDALMFSGTLKYYRKIFDGKLTLAVKPSLTSFYDNCPHVDDVIEYSDMTYERITSLPWSKLNRLIRWWLNVYWMFRKPVRKWDVVVCPVRSVSWEMLWIIRNIDAPVKIGITGCPSNFPENQQYLKKETFTGLGAEGITMVGA